MEYKKSENSWQESVENDNIDEALRRIQIQIATNFMDVHNKFCHNKIDSPMDVFVHSLYGKTPYDNEEQTMKMFMQIKEEFVEATCGLGVESTCPKEFVLETFQKIEEALKDAMSKL